MKLKETQNNQNNIKIEQIEVPILPVLKFLLQNITKIVWDCNKTDM